MPLTAAQRLGLSPMQPDVALPAINVKAPSISAITHAIVSNLPENCGLFRRFDSYITIEVEKDRLPDGTPTKKTIVREMTPTRLCSWLEKFMVFRNGGDDQAKATTLGKQTVEKIMASDTFRNAIREVREIAHVKLPVWKRNKDGSQEVALATAGYNSDLKLFISPEIEYDTDNARRITPNMVQLVWTRLVKEYPFLAESKAEENQEWSLDGNTKRGPHPVTNRSSCCALAFMVGNFVRFLYDRAPMIIVNGNQPGTGKTLLAVMCLAPVWGASAGAFTDKPKDDEEMTKTLNMVALEAKPFCVFDDIASAISQAINEFATQQFRTNRILGSAKSFTVPVNTQIVMTGNGLTTTPDIVRRSLIVDLWFGGEATERQLKNPTESKLFFGNQWRGSMLTFCWAMVRNWMDQGGRLTTPPSAKPSFESFAKIVGSILTANGFQDPFRKREADVAGGDMVGAATRQLIDYIAHIQRHPTDGSPAVDVKTYTVSQIIDISNSQGLTEAITRGKNANVAIGKQLSKLRGRTFITDGLPYIFGKGESAQSSNYTFVLKNEDSHSPV
ncbi:MAG: hypothetical protein Q3986_06470 [Akkermansia sp.]|nr:hypothetical protein [Akkermansia sp.]